MSHKKHMNPSGQRVEKMEAMIFKKWEGQSGLVCISERKCQKEEELAINF